MGTNWSLAGYAGGDVDLDELRILIQSRFDALTAMFSTWDAGSFISRFNFAPPGRSFSPPPAFVDLMQRATAIADASAGAFNPCLGAQIARTGFGSPLLRAGEGAIWRDARQHVAAEELFQPGGLQLDLSAIAKGAAVDELAGLAVASGISSLLVEIGGEFVGIGVKPDGLPWWVEIEPVAHGDAPWRIAACGLAVATSGNGYAFREKNAQRISHITPLVAEGGPQLRSVTVIHETCADADAWATALFAGGADGPALARRRDIAALFLYEDQPAVVSPAANVMLQQ